jgi:hypothetical protein
MRRTIGKRLTESKQQLPHYYLTVEVNMGKSHPSTGGYKGNGGGQAEGSARKRNDCELEVQSGDESWRTKCSSDGVASLG